MFSVNLIFYILNLKNFNKYNQLSYFGYIFIESFIYTIKKEKKSGIILYYITIDMCLRFIFMFLLLLFFMCCYNINNKNTYQILFFKSYKLLAIVNLCKAISQFHVVVFLIAAYLISSAESSQIILFNQLN